MLQRLTRLVLGKGKPPTLEIHVPISPTSPMLNMGRALTLSLRRNGGVYRDAPIVFTVGAAALSVGTCIFTNCDDCSGNHLLGPTIPENLRGVTRGKIVFDAFAGVGANSVVLPGVHFPEGSGIGALTLAHRSLKAWTLYLGVPMRQVRRTSEHIKVLAEELRSRERVGIGPGSITTIFGLQYGP